MDFMSDALYRGRRFRTLNILDEGVRELLTTVIDTSIPSGRVIRTLDQLLELGGKPAAIRCDNGPEFCAQAFIDWCKEHGIEIRYIQPGKPNQNAFIERFNKAIVMKYSVHTCSRHWNRCVKLLKDGRESITNIDRSERWGGYRQRCMCGI